MKKFIKILASLLVLVLIAAFAATFFLGSIIKKAVNEAGPQLLGADVRLESASLSLFTGTSTIKGLTIGNPQGAWKGDKAIYLGTAHIKLNLPSLLTKRIIIENILIDAPEIYFESDLKTSNLQVLAANVDQNTAGTSTQQQPSPQPRQQPAPEKKSDAKPADFELQHFSLTNAKVSAQLPNNKGGTLTVPAVTLENIGTREGGIPIGKIVGQILGGLTKQVAKSATEGALKNLTPEKLPTSSKELKDSAKDAAQEVKSLFKK